MDIVKILTSLMGAQGNSNQGNNMMGTIAKAAIPMILMGLFKNAQSKKGAESLTNALGQHEQDNSNIDIFSRVQNSNTNDGMNILKHIFGNDAETLADQIANKAGVTNAQAKETMGSLAPIILETLANKTKSGRSVDNVRSSLIEELTKVDNEPSAPNIPDIFKQVLTGSQAAQQKQGGLGGILSSILGGGSKQEEQSSGGLMDMLGGAEGIGNILQKMM